MKRKEEEEREVKESDSTISGILVQKERVMLVKNASQVESC